MITLVFYKFYKKKFGLIRAFIHNLFLGGILLIGILEANKALAKNKVEYEVHKITHLKHSESGNRSQRNLTLNVSLVIDNKQKTFALSNGNSKKILGNINNWKVRVGTRKGGLGYTFVESINALD